MQIFFTYKVLYPTFKKIIVIDNDSNIAVVNHKISFVIRTVESFFA